MGMGDDGGGDGDDRVGDDGRDGGSNDASVCYVYS